MPRQTLKLTEVDSIGLNGIKTELLVFSGELCNHPVKVLIDSGATRNFVSTSSIQDHDMKLDRRETPLVIKTADGTTHMNDKYLRQREIRIQGYSSLLDFEVFPLKDYDVILGKCWLELVDPRIEYATNKISLKVDGEEFHLKARDGEAEIDLDQGDSNKDLDLWSSNEQVIVANDQSVQLKVSPEKL